MASPSLNPGAPHHIPWFITTPGHIDGLFIGMIVFIIAIIFLLGIIYLTLHALPEKRAHAATKLQFELVSILAVLALFTHNNLLWIIALLLAFVQLPDFSTPIKSMSESLEKIATRGSLNPRREIRPSAPGFFAPPAPKGDEQTTPQRRADRA